MRPVVQKEKTGCGIASVAAVADVSYGEAKRIAHSVGIYAEDRRLWSKTSHVRRLLKCFGIPASRKEEPFRSWHSLPDLALIALKWHKENRQPFWHWAVFVRANGRNCVLDSKKALRHHLRTDFGRMKPKWFIRLHPRREPDSRPKEDNGFKEYFEKMAGILKTGGAVCPKLWKPPAPKAKRGGTENPPMDDEPKNKAGVRYAAPGPQSLFIHRIPVQI